MSTETVHDLTPAKPVPERQFVIGVDLIDGQDFNLPTLYASEKAALAEAQRLLSEACIPQLVITPHRAWLVHPRENVRKLVVQEKREA